MTTDEYLVEFLNSIKHLGINTWALSKAEAMAYDTEDSHLVIYLTKYAILLDKWINNPLLALEYKRMPYIVEQLALYFLQHGAPHDK